MQNQPFDRQCRAIFGIGQSDMVRSRFDFGMRIAHCDPQTREKIAQEPIG